MESAVEMARILFPLVLVSGMAVFVVRKMRDKYEKETLGKKKSKGAQILLDSLIPFGMIIGSTIAVFLSLFFPISLLSTIGLGAGIGLLFGILPMISIAKWENKKDNAQLF